MGRNNVFEPWNDSEILNEHNVIVEIPFDEFIKHAREIYDRAIRTNSHNEKVDLFIRLWHPPVVPTETCPWSVFKDKVNDPEEMISSIVDGEPIKHEDQWDMLVEMYKMMEEEIKRNREEYEKLMENMKQYMDKKKEEILKNKFDF